MRKKLAFIFSLLLLPVKLYNHVNSYSGGFTNSLRSALLIFRNSGLSGLVATIRNSTYFLLKVEEPNSVIFEKWFASNYWRNDSFYNHPCSGTLKISIVVPIYNAPITFLDAAIESVFSQVHQNWELLLVDDCSTDESTIRYLQRLNDCDRRLRILSTKQNLGISGASNVGLDHATGDIIVFLDQDDLLFPWSLSAVCESFSAHPHINFAYSDEILIDENGIATSGHFKSDLDRTLARSYNYFCHLSCYRTEFLTRNELRFSSYKDGAQDFDLALRSIDLLPNQEVFHIDKVLYGWRIHGGSTASNINVKPYALNAGLSAIRDHLARNEIGAEVSVHDKLPGAYRATYKMTEFPLVSIIIPTKDSTEYVRNCISSIIEKTTYPNYEIILVDNRSSTPEFQSYTENHLPNKVRLLFYDQEFNYSAINNYAARESQGQYLCLLNNDTEVISPDWLSDMMSLAVKHTSGAIGAKLFYEDTSIQHAGVILGIGLVAGHSHRSFNPSSLGYMGRLVIDQEYSAVTAACLLVSRDKFFEVSGLTEELSVGYNDVDFCLKLRDRGYVNIFCSQAELFHFESKSRGYDTTPEKIARANSETIYMRKKWMKVIERDPYYNIHLTRHLEDWSLNHSQLF